MSKKTLCGALDRGGGVGVIEGFVSCSRMVRGAARVGREKSKSKIIASGKSTNAVRGGKTRFL